MFPILVNNIFIETPLHTMQYYSLLFFDNENETTAYKI